MNKTRRNKARKHRSAPPPRRKPGDFAKLLGALANVYPPYYFEPLYNPGINLAERCILAAREKAIREQHTSKQS